MGNSSKIKLKESESLKQNHKRIQQLYMVISVGNNYFAQNQIVDVIYIHGPILLLTRSLCGLQPKVPRSELLNINKIKAEGLIHHFILRI